MNAFPAAPLRLLIVPGLHDSPPGHWQSWLQARHPLAVRVQQRDWSTPDLERWAARIGSTLERSGPGRWLVAAHSFGVLALLRHLARLPQSPVAAVLLVAPADPTSSASASCCRRERCRCRAPWCSAPTTPGSRRPRASAGLGAGVAASRCWARPATSTSLRASGRCRWPNAGCSRNSAGWARCWRSPHRNSHKQARFDSFCAGGAVPSMRRMSIPGFPS